MRATVYWYSGTGNSWLAAGRLAERLREGGAEAVLVPMEDSARAAAAARADARAAGAGGAPDGGEAVHGGAPDLEIFCFPIYAFNAPSAVARFVRALPLPSSVQAAAPAGTRAEAPSAAPAGAGAAASATDGGPTGAPASAFAGARAAATRKAALVATMGGKGYDGRALRRLERMLRDRGREVVLAEALEMPEAFVQAYSATPPEAAEARTAAALALADTLAKELLSGGGRFRADRPALRILLTPVSVLFALVARRLLGLSWGCDGLACTGCGLCARACPAGNIRMAGQRPSFGAACEDCQRCANLCPTGAIRVSALKLLVYAILSFPSYGRILAGLFGLALPAGPFGFLLRAALWLAGALAAFAAAAFAFRVAESRPAGRNFLSRSYATGFSRRLAPGFQAELARRGRSAREGRAADPLGD